MIISGGSRSNWRFFAGHLTKTTENERVDLVEFRGLAADTVLEAFREMSALSMGTKCKNFFYHANLNPRGDEVLTPEQWEQAVDTLERELGLEGHSRFIVEHEKDGRTHRHVVWSRIDPDTMTTTSDSNNYRAHERAARALENLFGHAPVVGVHSSTTGERPKRRPKNWETFRGHESRIDPEEVARTVTKLWQRSDSAQAFVAGLAEHKMQLCKGDYRDYCLMDAAGDIHSLARRIDGVKAAEIRKRLADLDPASVLTIEEARAKVPRRKRRSAEDRDKQPKTSLDRFAEQITKVLRRNNSKPKQGDPMEWWDRQANIHEIDRDAGIGPDPTGPEPGEEGPQRGPRR